MNNCTNTNRLTLLAVGLALLCGVTCSRGAVRRGSTGSGKVESTAGAEAQARPYSLAYIDTEWRLRVRWSSDLISWKSAQGGAPSIDFGPGLGADASGLAYLTVFGSGTSRAEMMMGIGPDVWDNSSVRVGDGHTGTIRSGTSIVHVSDLNWLVAYKNGQGRAEISLLNTDRAVRDFTANVTPVAATINANLTDKPGIANRNGAVLASWLMTNKLQMVTGRISGTNLSWDPGYQFDGQVTEQGFGPPVGAHAITADSNQFYAAVVRQRNPLPGEPVKLYFLFLYTSVNGQTWTKLGPTFEVVQPQAVSAAARSATDLVVMVSSPGDLAPPILALHFDGTRWTQLKHGDILGDHLNNRGHDFSLFVPGPVDSNGGC